MLLVSCPANSQTHSCINAYAHSYNNIECLLPIVLAKHPKVQQHPNSFPFRFSCNLAEHPLFQMPRLVELMSSIADQSPEKVTCVATKGNSNNRNWSGRIHPERFAEIVAHTEETGLLILIKDAQQDLEYQLFLHTIVNELGKQIGQIINQNNTWIDAYISIAPPNPLPRYPLHHELNFLFQIYEERSFPLGEKPSMFISLVSFPKAVLRANLHLFAVKSFGGAEHR
jgi:hypothetical protein